MRSLRTKLVLYISVLVAALVGISGFIEVRKRSNELNQELVEGSANFAAISGSTLLEASRGLYYQPDKFSELEAKVRQIMNRNKALVRVQEVDALFGIVLFDSREFEEGYYGFKREPRVFESSELLKDLRLGKVKTDPQAKVVRVVVPLFAGKEVGDPRDVNRAMIYYFSTEQVEQALAAMRLRYALQALAFVLLGILLAALESSAITRPLRTLTEGVKRLGAGDLSHRVVLKTRDELGMLGDSFNAMAGSLKQSRDDLVRALEQLEKQNVELKQLDALKDQFLANTSHELRTPINGILGLVTAVLEGADGPVNPKQARHLQMVKESGERLKNLITNILDFSKLKSGKEKFDVAPFRLADLGVQIAALGEGLLRGKPVTMVVELPGDLPPVYGDHERVMQVLTNLVGNASKFTEKGHIRVYAQPRGDEMVIAVEDTGPGIPKEAREYLFQEFRQVDGGTARAHEGTGLGLAISRQLVQRMGGRIDFRSEVGKGTVFFFTLPAKPGAVPVEFAEAAKMELSAASGAEGLTAAFSAGGFIGGTSVGAAPVEDLAQFRGNGEIIGVVDDIPENVESLKLLLEQHGYKPVTASSPKELLTRMAHEKMHLVLADVRMPGGMNGVEMCRHIRSTPEIAEVPVFLVTAQAATADDLHEATEAGADAYVVKPYDPGALLERIHATLQPRPDVPRGQGQRVLVVDDSKVAAEGISYHLKAFGYHPVLANADNALDVAVKEKPDIALLDIRLGKVTGYELCQQLRADGRLLNLPVVFLTGLASPTDKLRYREVGAQDLLQKPVAVDDLMRRLSFHLKRAAAQTSKQGNGEYVLVVDDVPVNVEALATQLEHRGFKPLRATSGAEALKIARQQRPAAVITDVMMPGMTGYDLTRELMKDPDIGQPPVILLTAQTGSVQDKLIGFDAGAIDYVVKPFETEELVARLQRVLHRAQSAFAAGSSSGTSITRIVETTGESSSSSGGMGLDIRGAGEVVLCVDDNPINLEVLKTNLESVNYRAVLANDGFEALKALEKHPVELILCDVMMPKMTGYQFIAKMRENPKWKEIPVVMVSAKDRQEDAAEGFKHGVVDYVTKPFNPALVSAKVAAILALRRAQSALGTINAELNVARLVQQASFPQQVLDLPGYAVRGLIQCADTSGGDWYGYFTNPKKDRMTLISGDVTGHGISAALVALAVNSIKNTVELYENLLDTSETSQTILSNLDGKVSPAVHAGLQRLLQVPHSPAALAGLINEVFCQSRSFLQMTAVVANLEMKTGTLKYTLAGAPRPLQLRRSQKTPGTMEVGSLVAPPSSILGHDRQAKFVEQTTVLQPGESVLVFSDGLSEAKNLNDEEYGTRRMAQSLLRITKENPPDALRLRDTLLQDVFTFTGDAPLKDDITLVVMQRLAS